MKINNYNLEKGFTLIELMVVLAVSTALIFLATDMLRDIFLNSSQQLMSMDDIDQSRLVATKFTNEIRNAQIGNDGSYPLKYAADNQIIFYTSFGTSGLSVNRIRYYVSNNTLYEGIIIPTGSPLIYNLNSETVRPVQNDLSPDSLTHLFYYYDGNFNGTGNALAQPVNINQVRYVKISLKILNKTSANNSSTFSLNAGGAIRSLKDNLGN